jgi:[ribosomal protein S5]-alanine N-acetyltransferase
MPTVQLVTFTLETYEALETEELERASDAVGVPLPPEFLAATGHWRMRRDQIHADPATAAWLVRAVVGPDGEVVGDAGFHGPPDDRGMVEMGYAILPRHRRRGFGTAAVAALVAFATEHGARVLRASIAPDNAASLALARRFGLEPVGEHVDDEDGRELELERPLAAG